MADSRPIGVFDSGVGGLTVLRALHAAAPMEPTIYLGDLQRCPYGTRPQTEVRDFAVQIGDYLAALDIKLLVVACNTATAAAFDTLRDRHSIPVIGVIEPGAREASRVTRNSRIGVIATAGTVESGAYGAAVTAAGPCLTVFERSASWLVPLIERGMLARAVIAARLAPTIEELRALEIDTLILGCTHFPIVRDIFEAEAGPGIAVVDSASTTAREVERLLDEHRLRSAGPGSHRVLVTGPAESFAERAQAMFRAAPDVELVSLSVDQLVR